MARLMSLWVQVRPWCDCALCGLWPMEGDWWEREQ